MPGDWTGAGKTFRGDEQPSGKTLGVIGASTGRHIKVDTHKFASISTVVGLPSIPAGATHALLSVDTAAAASIRFREDGTDPTSTVGHEVAPGQAVEFAVRPLSDVKLIAVSGSVPVQVSYRRYDVDF